MATHSIAGAAPKRLVEQRLPRTCPVLGCSDIDGVQLTFTRGRFIVRAERGADPGETDERAISFGEADDDVIARVAQDLLPHAVTRVDIPLREVVVRKQVAVRFAPSRNVQRGDGRGILRLRCSNDERHPFIVPESECRRVGPRPVTDPIESVPNDRARLGPGGQG